jgi:hypothetical protein
MNILHKATTGQRNHLMGNKIEKELLKKNRQYYMTILGSNQFKTLNSI